MKTHYYIAKRQFNGRLRYSGDGVINAESERIARRVIGKRYGVRPANVLLKIRETQEFLAP